MTTERIVLYTNKAAFQQAVEEYAERKQIEAKIKAEVKHIIPGIKFSNSFYDAIEINFYNALEKAHPKFKEMGIKATKIPDMLDLDLSRLLNLATAYNRQNRYGHMIKDVQSPSISDFEVIAETDEEIKEYETAKAFIEACKDLENKFNIKMFAGTIAQSTKGVIGADQAQGLGADALRFNHVRILNKRRHKKREKALSL